MTHFQKNDQPKFQTTALLPSLKHIATALFLCSFICWSGCDILSSKKNAESSGTPEDTASTEPNDSITLVDDPLGCARSCPNCDEAKRDDLFFRDSIPVFDLVLPPDRWQYLQGHALDEEYEPACISFEGKSIGTVGLRFKGSYGTLIPCVDKNTGAIICDKLSMKVKFNEVYPDARFHGLKRLNLHSLKNDPTKVRERLGYDLYREMGIQAPLSGWANVRINGKSYGIYTMVEQIDGRFTENRWPGDGEGNLFKEAWPSSTDPDYYIEHLKTNKKTGSADAMIKFYSALSAAAPEQRYAVLAKWMDTDYLHTYMAVDDAISNVDGSTAFYIDSKSEWAGNHNYYIYQEEKRDKFWKIPWDLDATFQFTGGWGAIPHWTQTPDDCSKRYPVWNGRIDVVAPGCNLIFQTLAQNRDPYKNAITTLLEGPFSEARILAKIDVLVGFIDKAVQADPKADYTGWNNEVSRLKANIPLLRQRLENLRDDKQIKPFSIVPTALNTLEDVSNTGLRIGAELMHNAASSATMSVHTAAPLADLQDIRLDFIYRDGPEPWQQWIFWSLPFETASTT